MTPVFNATFDQELPVNGDAPEWVHLLPSGKMKARDGRSFDLANPEAIIRDFEARAVDLPIDYEHQMDRPEAQLKGPVPAAGWIKELVTMKSGLWGRVEWTATARDMIARKEYRFLSPSILHDKTGRVTRLVGAGLVHKPALHLKALAKEETDLKPTPAAPETSPERPWSAFVERLREILGLDEEATEEEALEALEALVKPVKATAAQVPDPAKYVPIDAVRDLMANHQAQRATLREGEAKTKVDAALRSGHLTPAMKPWALALCQSDPESFDDFLTKSAAPYAHLHQRFDHMVHAPGSARPAVSAEVQAICSQLGLKPEQLITE